MFRRFQFVAGLWAVVIILTALLPAAALAHERRTIGGGKYDVVVGFDKEPAFVNQQNAAAIRIFKAGTQDPVEGAEKTLKVQIAFGGGQPKEFPLRAVFGQKGYYVADYFPTKAGTYIWMFTGSIEDTVINERFESGPGRFNNVESVEALQFPQAVPDSLTMANQVRALQDEVGTARLFAIAGIVAGVLGLAVGVVSLLSRRQGEPAPDASKRVPQEGRP